MNTLTVIFLLTYVVVDIYASMLLMAFGGVLPILAAFLIFLEAALMLGALFGEVLRVADRKKEDEQ